MYICILYQKEALENFKMLLNKSKGSDLPESVTSNFSEHGNDRVVCSFGDCFDVQCSKKNSWNPVF